MQWWSKLSRAEWQDARVACAIVVGAAVAAVAAGYYGVGPLLCWMLENAP